MRPALGLLVALPLAGCLAPTPDAAAPPPLSDAQVVSFTVASACIGRGAPLEATLALRNPGGGAGRASVGVYAQQYGYVAQADVDLGAHETRNVTLRGSIDLPGRWTLFAQGPRVMAGQASVTVLDPDDPGSRCP